MRGAGTPTGSGRRVVFVGAVHEAEPALRVLLGADVDVVTVVTVPPERSAARSGYVDLEPLAGARGVPVLQVADLNAPGTVARLRALQPDLLVVVGWSQLVCDELLSLPPRGCVGFHASLLPRGRGRAPVNWSIIHGEDLTGNTMIYLAPGADTGDIVAQRRIVIGPDDTCHDVYERVGQVGAQLLAEHLPGLLAGTAPRRRQRDAAATSWPKRTPAMGITDWDRPARAVHDWIRAQTRPYPGAFGSLGGRQVMLWRSVLQAGDAVPAGSGAARTPAPPPGMLLGLEAGGMRVSTADGSVLLTEVGDPGGLPEPAHVWFCSNGFRSGDRFEPVDAGVAQWALGLRPRSQLEAVGAR